MLNHIKLHTDKYAWRLTFYIKFFTGALPRFVMKNMGQMSYPSHTLEHSIVGWCLTCQFFGEKQNKKREPRFDADLWFNWWRVSFMFFVFLFCFVCPGCCHPSLRCNPSPSAWRHWKILCRLQWVWIARPCDGQKATAQAMEMDRRIPQDPLGLTLLINTTLVGAT